jgi:hypothetical protein
MDSEEDGYYSGNPSLTSLDDIKSIYDQYMAQAGPSTDVPVELNQSNLAIQVNLANEANEANQGNEAVNTAEVDATDINAPAENDDGDSAYDSESLLGDDTRSLASYITDYRYEHGRRYHAFRDGAYWVSF